MNQYQSNISEQTLTFIKVKVTTLRAFYFKQHFIHVPLLIISKKNYFFYNESRFSDLNKISKKNSQFHFFLN
jgi:hypothetical protein